MEETYLGYKRCWKCCPCTCILCII